MPQEGGENSEERKKEKEKEGLERGERGGGENNLISEERSEGRKKVERGWFEMTLNYYYWTMVERYLNFKDEVGRWFNSWL